MQQATTHSMLATSLLKPTSAMIPAISNTSSSSPSKPRSPVSSASTSTSASTSVEATTSSPPSSSSSPRGTSGRQWTESETQLLLEGVQRCGEQWEVIASLFTPKRTILDCSKHYYAFTQSKRKRPTSVNVKTNNGELEFNPPLRRVRKTYSEIQRPFQCTEPDCSKAYGTEGALKMHKKLKHGIIHPNANSSSPPPASGDETAPHSPNSALSPFSQSILQSQSPSPPACNNRTASMMDGPVISSKERPTEDGRRTTRPKFSSLLSPPPQVKSHLDSKTVAQMTFEIDKLSTGIEISAADGSYKISLSIQMAGAIILDIASRAENIRLIFSLNDTQIVAKSLDECLMKPSPTQLQLVVSETPEILLQSPQDGLVMQEWRKLAIANVPTASKLDLIARSPIYEISMKFSNYVALLQTFTADLLIKQRVQLVSTLLPSMTAPSSSASTSTPNPISQRQNFPSQLQSSSLPGQLQLGQGASLVSHQLMSYPVLQTQQLQNLSSLVSQLSPSQQQQLLGLNSMSYLSRGSPATLSELLSNLTQPASSNTGQSSHPNFPPSF